MVNAVGNKDDNPDRKEVLSQDAQKFAAQSGITLFETSAKDNTNVEEVCVGLYELFLCTVSVSLSITKVSN